MNTDAVLAFVAVAEEGQFQLAAAGSASASRRCRSGSRSAPLLSQCSRGPVRCGSTCFPASAARSNWSAAFRRPARPCWSTQSPAAAGRRRSRHCWPGRSTPATPYLRDRAAELGPSLTSVYAYLEPMQVIVGPRHPLAQADLIRPADLARYPAWVPGIVAGSEWETFHQDLAADFGLDIDPHELHDGNRVGL